MSEHDLIWRHPHVRGGAPCVVGTRITVREIQEALNAGMSYDDIFPDDLTVEEIRAASKVKLVDVHCHWRGGGVDILEGEEVMQVSHSGTAKIPLSEVPTAIATMQTAYDQALALREKQEGQ